MTDQLKFLRRVVDECIITAVDYDEGTTMYRDPYPALLLGRKVLLRFEPYWWRREGKLTLFELPDCDQATELKEHATITLANVSEAMFFEEGQELTEGNGHVYLCGRIE